MIDKLAILSSIERRLAAVETVDEAKAIRDQAEALRVYAKSVRKGLSIQNRAAAIKILAEQRAGGLIRTMERAQGARDGQKGLLFTLNRSEIPWPTAHQKPVVVEAVRWTTENKMEITEFTHSNIVLYPDAITKSQWEPL